MGTHQCGPVVNLTCTECMAVFAIGGMEIPRKFSGRCVVCALGY